MCFLCLTSLLRRYSLHRRLSNVHKNYIGQAVMIALERFSMVQRASRVSQYTAYPSPCRQLWSDRVQRSYRINRPDRRQRPEWRDRCAEFFLYNSGSRWGHAAMLRRQWLRDTYCHIRRDSGLSACNYGPFFGAGSERSYEMHVLIQRAASKHEASWLCCSAT